MRVPLAMVVVVLAGCSDIPRARTEDEIRTIAIDAASVAQSALEARIEAMEAELSDLRGDQERDRRFSVETYNDLNSLRNTVNSNARIENENKLRAMTASGACGVERVNYDNGGWALRNKQCTLKDLR